MELVMKRDHELTGLKHDEYLLSDGLYRIIGTELEVIKGA